MSLLWSLSVFCRCARVRAPHSTIISSFAHVCVGAYPTPPPPSPKGFWAGSGCLPSMLAVGFCVSPTLHTKEFWRAERWVRCVKCKVPITYLPHGNKRLVAPTAKEKVDMHAYTHIHTHTYIHNHVCIHTCTTICKSCWRCAESGRNRPLCCSKKRHNLLRLFFKSLWLQKKSGGARTCNSYRKPHKIPPPRKISPPLQSTTPVMIFSDTEPRWTIT